MRLFRPTFAVILLTAGGPTAGADPRPLTPDDLFRIQEFGDITVGPDGAEAAVVVRAPVTPGRGHGRPLLLDGDRSDVFLARTAGGDPKPLTDGAADGSGFWRPLWSPDGRRLAVLSTRGGDNVRLFVWDRAADKVRRLTEDGVDLWAAVDPVTHAPFVWLDDRRLLCALVPPGGAHTAFTLDFPARRGATAGWAAAAKGAASTASVLDSGRPGTPAPTGRLALIDAEVGTTVTVAGGNCIEALASPDGKSVAVVVEAGRYKPREGKPLPAFTDRGPSRVGVATLTDPPAVRWIDGIEPKTKIRRTQFNWAGDRVAALGKPDPDAERPDTLFLAGPDGNSRRVGGADFRVSATTRVGDTLLALGRFGGTGREDWYAIAPDTPPAAVTAALSAVPDVWHALGDRAAVGMAGGKLWRLDAAGACAEFPLMGGRKATRIVGPARVGPGGATPEIVVECRPPGGELVRVPADPAGEQVVMPRPADPTAKLIDYRPGGAALFTAVTPNGASVWVTAGPNGTFTRPFVLNEFLSEIADPRFRVIDYRGADGGPLKAHLLLPPGHRDGDRHPTVVWVYAGNVLDNNRGTLLQKNTGHTFNLCLLAARGYAVLVPSMPLGPEGKAADPLIELPKGVLPAVDKAVELGLADPARVAVMGHSYGGYSVYGLLTQTTRFKAGIAMAGITDLVALHGTLDARVRYDADPFFNMFGPKWTEVGQGRMGGSPWADPDRYRRNSPITYADRVRTPLLMMHGDSDFVPLQQAEEFYTALLRLGRRARLVRYWGEGHVVDSPANVRDLWGQVFAWLDEHLSAGKRN